jgi:branched-chain amino acid aminotransferase
MTEYSRDCFILNGLVIQTEDFNTYFSHPARYIYEVFRVVDGIPVFIEDHLERLWNTAMGEGVVLPYSKQDLLSFIYRLIDQNSPENGNIKIAIIKAAVNQYDTLVYYTPHQYPTETQYKQGVAVGLFQFERMNPNEKVMDAVFRETADQTKYKNQLYELLLVDRDGYVTEGSRSNVFFIKRDSVLTPPGETVLEGITRKQVFRICNHNRLNISQKKIHISVLESMDAVFLTGTSRKILPVSKVDNLVFKTAHPLIGQLSMLFDKSLAEYLNTHKR